jgi:hypothetical protein
MITSTWTNLAPTPDTWYDFTFNDLKNTTWNQIFDSYVITDPSLEVVNDIYGLSDCESKPRDYLPTIMVYDTVPPGGATDGSSSENTNIIRLFNKGCHINLKWVTRIYLVLPDDTYISSQILPDGLYWDDWFIYMQLGQNNLWDNTGEGFFRIRLLIRLQGSVVSYFWGFLRIKVLLGGELI